MRKLLLPLLLLAICCISNSQLKAQQSVGIGTTTPNTESILDLDPSSPLGLLMPRLVLNDTNSFSTVAANDGMIFYATDINAFVYYDASTTFWTQVGSGAGGGTNGLTSLITATPEAPGVNCTEGGQRIDIGLDDNGDSALDPGEIDNTFYVCNGAAGIDGLDGDRYATTSTTTLTIGSGNRVLTVDTGLAYTPAQTVLIAFDASNFMEGTINTYNPSTGVLDVNVPIITGPTGSGTFSAWTVNLAGAPGPAGTDGLNSLANSTPEAPGVNCTDGGQRIDVGLDDNDDGILQAGEIDDTYYICDGAAGAAGPAGANGADGLNSLALSTVETPGVNCTDGGQRIDVGLDDNDDGILQAGEIDDTYYICDGATGPAGAAGPAGADGLNSLSASIVEAPGVNCTDGGQRIDVGLDDNDDGILQAGEIDFTYYVCDGAVGAAGANGIDGLNSLAASTIEAPGVNCTDGGQRLDVGLDDNNDGILQGGEIDFTYYVCDGAAGANGLDGLNSLAVSTLEAPGVNCTDGGQRIDVGLDDNNDAILQAGEIDDTYYICDGTPGPSSLQAAYDGGQTINMGSGNIDFISSGANSVLYIDEANERVGIGNTSPTYSLDILNTTSASAINAITNFNAARNEGINSLVSGSASENFGISGRGVGGTLSIGVNGEASNASSSNIGVRGVGFNTVNTGWIVGVQGEVQGVTTATNAYGVNAIATATGSTNNIGINSTASGATNNYGIYSTATGGTTNYAAYFEDGDVVAENGNVGIGTTTPANKLEVIGDAAKFDSVIIANNAQVGYVLTAADATGAASWQSLPANTAWDLLGNAGTIDGTNFIGSTDNVPLTFRVNNTRVGRLTTASATFIGFNAGASLIGDGGGAVGFGYEALTTATSAGGNTAIGHQSLRLTTGNTNTALGIRAGEINTTGAGNTFIGSNTAATNVTGSQLTLLGNSSDVSVDALTNATAIGANSVVSQSNSLVLGNNANVGIGTSTPANRLEVIGDAAKFDSVIIVNGAQTGYVLTSNATGEASWQPLGASTFWDLTGNAGTVDGTNFLGTTDDVPLNFRMNNQPSGRIENSFSGNANTGIGYQAGNNGGGVNNAAFGFRALASNTADGNTALGSNALENNTTDANTGLGYATLRNATGTRNTAVGNAAMELASTGDDNVAVGYTALLNNEADANTAVGSGALAGTTTGSGNTAVGERALVGNTLGIQNTAVGLTALFGNTNGDQNVGVGFDALFTNTTGNNNVGIGWRAGFDLDGGSNNVFIGYDANAGNTNINNSVALGYNAVVSQDNSIVLGDTADIRVGIGTSSPVTNLHIEEDFVNVRLKSRRSNTSASTLMEFGRDNGAGGFVSTGSVGTPGSGDNLQLATSNTLILNAGLTARLTISNSGAINLPDFAGSGRRVLTVNNSGFVGSIDLSDSVNWARNGTSIYNTNTGNVGIGITNPAFELDVNGDINALNSYYLGADQFISTNGSNSIHVGINAGHGNGAGFGTFIGVNAGALTTGVSNTFVGTESGENNVGGTQNAFFGLRSGRNNSDGGSNTFIGRSAGELNTSGDENTFLGRDAGNANTIGTRNTILGRSADVLSNNLTNATAIGYSAFVGSSNSMVLGGVGANAVNVGIGLTNPINTLDVEGGVAIGSSYSGTSVAPAEGLIVEGRVGIGTGVPIEQLHVSSVGVGVARFESTNNPLITIYDNGSYEGYIQSFNDDMVFGTAPGSSGNVNLYAGGTNRVVVENTGDVGIGAANPTTKLHIQETSTATTPQVYIENTSTGDAALRMIAGSNWSLGIDNSDSDKFKLANGTTVASGTSLTIETDGDMGLGTVSPGVTTGAGRYLTVATGTFVTNSYASLELQGGQGTIGQPTAMIDFISNSGIGNSAIGRIQSVTANGAQFNGDLEFYTRDNTPFASSFLSLAMRLTSDNNIESGGDLITSAGNGVINVGGSINTNANVIGDVASPTINIATGDEDLFIDDVLEVGTQAYKPGGGSWVTISDFRLKRNVQPFTDGLSKLLQINPVTFQYNELAGVNQERIHVGIIAQDVEPIIPYSVETKAIQQKIMEDENGNEIIIDSGKGDFKTFDPSSLDFLIINAIKEQQQIIDSQNQLIQDLEMRIQALENK